MKKIIYKNVTVIQDSELGEVAMNNEKDLDAKITVATEYKEEPEKKPSKKKR